MISTMGGPEGKVGVVVCVRADTEPACRFQEASGRDIRTCLQHHVVLEVVPLVLLTCWPAVLCCALGLQAKGNFLLLDSDLNIKGTWGKEDTAFGYDFW